MFKGKIGIWVIIMAVCLIIQSLFGAASIFKKQPVNETVLSDVDENFFTATYERTFSKYRLNTTREQNSNTDIVISNAGSTDNIDGYTKYPKQFYSPMIIYMRHLIADNSEGLKNDASSSALSIDLYNILIGLEESKTWVEIGISEDVYDGPIELVVPNEQSPYYSYVKQLFYMTLSTGSNEDESSLNNRVEEILNKCTKVRDISVAMDDYYASGSKTFYKKSSENKAFIGPEFYEKTLQYSDDNKNHLIPVYLFETTCIELDAFVKNDDETASNFIEYVQAKSKFFENTMWRVKNCKYKASNSDYHFINTIPGYIS